MVEYDLPIPDASVDGGIRIEHQDHDHCSVCYDVAFSERFDGDLREGWRTLNPRSGHNDHEWVCPTGFDERREKLRWTVVAS